MVLSFMLRNRGRRGPGPFRLGTWRSPRNVAASVITNFIRRRVNNIRTRRRGLPAPGRSLRNSQLSRGVRARMVAATRRMLARRRR